MYRLRCCRQIEKKGYSEIQFQSRYEVSSDDEFSTRHGDIFLLRVHESLSSYTVKCQTEELILGHVSVTTVNFIEAIFRQRYQDFRPKFFIS